MPGSPTPSGGDTRNLSRRLLLFGLLSIVVGAGATGLGLLNLAIPFLNSRLPDAPPSPWGVAAAGAITWGMLGALFVWAGIGSMRCRRWTRSIMLTLAWSWLLFGVMTLVLGFWMLDDVLAQAAATSGQPLPAGFAGLFKAIMLAILSVGGIVLPLAFVWAYSDIDVLHTCAARHPAPDWTAACPLRALGLSLGLAACGVLGLPLALHPVVPFFGRVLTGAPAVAVVLAGSAVCLWLARSIYRLQRIGWWGTVVFLIAIGATVAVTFVVVDMGEFLLVYGLPRDQAVGMAGFGPAMVWGSVVLTLASVGYLVAIRSDFATPR